MIRRIGIGMVGLAASCLVGAVTLGNESKHPRDPWVFRSVLDGQARMLTCALNDRLYASYDTKTATLYRVWAGTVYFTGGVYDARHGPQPKSVGPAYFRHTGDGTAWSVQADGKDTDVKPHYLGYKLGQDDVTISYAFDLPGGRVTVDEMPACDVSGDKVTLIRTFKVSGLPEKATLTLDLSGESGDLNVDQDVDKAKSTTRPSVKDKLQFTGDSTICLRTSWSTR